MLDHESAVKATYAAVIGIVAGLLTAFTSLTISNTSRVGSIEADMKWIREALARIEAADVRRHQLP